MNKLREIRFLKGISQWRLSHLSRVHQSRISLSENELVDLTADEKKRLAEILCVDPEQLFGNKPPTSGGKKRKEFPPRQENHG